MSHATITLLGALGLLIVALVATACYVLAERRRGQQPGRHRPGGTPLNTVDDETRELPVIPALTAGMDLETSLSLITAAQQARTEAIRQAWALRPALVRPYVGGRHRAPEVVAA